jgi:hypothetical protein
MALDHADLVAFMERLVRNVLLQLIFNTLYLVAKSLMQIQGRNLAILLFSDVHLDCETKIAKFLGTQDSILYSYGISTIFSVIPAFCKKGDIIVA